MALKFSKEVRVGLFTLFSGVILYLGFNFLKGTDFFSRNIKLYAIYPDVGGLTVSNPVLVNGLAVGRIKALALLPNDSNKILATLEVDKNVPLPRGTQGLLAQTDLLGGKAVRLVVPQRGPGAPLPELLANKDTIPGGIEPGMLEAVSAKVSPMLANLDSVSTEIKVLLRSFRGTASGLNSTMASFKGTADRLNGVVGENAPSIKLIASNAARLSTSLVATEHSLQGLLQKFNRFADTLNQAQIARTMAGLNKSVASLNQVMAGVNAGQGSIGKLVKNDSLYHNLNKSSEDLDALLKDMKSRPSRYIHFSVFGKKEKN